MGRASKVQLRAAARVALERRGMRCELGGGAGVLPGARLSVSWGGAERKVAVRTATDGELGLVRHPDGRWKTLPAMDAVVLAAPATDDHTSIEVMWFDAAEVLQRFERELERRRARGQEVAPKIPIFLPLRAGGRGKRHSLVDAALWTERVDASGVSGRAAQTKETSLAGLIERVEREVAELTGLDREHFAIEVRISSQPLTSRQLQRSRSAAMTGANLMSREDRDARSEDGECSGGELPEQQRDS